tara:strand:+ start:7524 stop:7877 length:354 start_codon:yes stop_codon:yes gene_type:complete
MYSNINDIPPTKHYVKDDNAMSYYSVLHAIRIHKWDYEVNIPDMPYNVYCDSFIQGLNQQLYQWLRNVDYASYDHCDDVHSSDITWAIDCLIAYEKKEELDRDLELKYRINDRDLPF